MWLLKIYIYAARIIFLLDSTALEFFSPLLWGLGLCQIRLLLMTRVLRWE